MEMVTIKISKVLQKKIKKYVKSTGQTMSGYINIRLAECLQHDEKERRNLEGVNMIVSSVEFKDNNKQH